MNCGGCECPETHSGRSCECSLDLTSGQTATDLTEQCYRDGAGGDEDGGGSASSSSSEICEGRGTCFCGGCQCDQQFVGRCGKLGIIMSVHIRCSHEFPQVLPVRKGVPLWEGGRRRGEEGMLGQGDLPVRQG